MKAVRDKLTIQIEITNDCHNECANCTRFIGHHKKPYYMDLETIEKAIDSLKGYPHSIGIMGGEPTKHPQFEEICKLLQKKVPKEQRDIHTAGYKWDKYKAIIKKTFGSAVHVNKHLNAYQKHHPMLVAVKDVVPDRTLAARLIDNCWVDQRWSASINPQGCFSCEIAAALDILFDGPGGKPIEEGWWNKDPDFFSDQTDRYCYLCGAVVPFINPLVKDQTDYASASNYNRLKALQTPRFVRNRVQLFEDRYDEARIGSLLNQWKPWDHKGDGETKLSCYDLFGPIGGFVEKYDRIIRQKIRYKISHIKEISFTGGHR
ncbi:radical SAM protein [Desulfopila sp. IMCC35006]|uniref:radical SAM protein n=1 Tax=Desulfopila sp. IMCC35006 TaxID=2569542 RepID=UPI0010AD086D|nr:radical SAM protein [Desulfopila sp. IMCC35006]TKB23977.1 radical SAM protein [Desulfopila sp. IMCC35006]